VLRRGFDRVERLGEQCLHRERSGDFESGFSFAIRAVATGELRDPFPPPIEELARRYFEAYPPDVKA
jgi:hypothetical protein